MRPIHSRYLNLSIAILLLLLDVRDFCFKFIWLGPFETDSFTLSTTHYMQQPALIVDHEAIRNESSSASGWPSLLSMCRESHALVPEGRNEFHVVVATDCRFDQAKNLTKTVDTIVLNANIRVDSVVWAACELLFVGRRPSICQESIATGFNDRYAFDDTTVPFDDLSPIGSDEELELLQILDLISFSPPLNRIVCVEAGIMIPENENVPITMVGCGSPSSTRNSWIGLSNTKVLRLIERMGWLTTNRISFMNVQYGVRMNSKVSYRASRDGDRLKIAELITCNFVSYGQLFVITVILDLYLLFHRFLVVFEMLLWIFRPDYRRMHEWIYQIEHGFLPPSAPEDPDFVHLRTKTGGNATAVTPRQRPSILQRRTIHNTRQASGWKSSFDEVQLYAFFARARIGHEFDWLLRVLTQLASWILIMPNTLIWTSGDSWYQKTNGYLNAWKSWILVAICVGGAWGLLVRANEQRAYFFTARAFVTHVEVFVIGVLVAFGFHQSVSSVVEELWSFEEQRVRDATSFGESVTAYANTYNKAHDYELSSQRHSLWILYRPLFHIIVVSVAVISVWLVLKFAAFALMCTSAAQGARTRGAAIHSVDRPTDRSGESIDIPQSYHRLELERILDYPIRAQSILRSQLSLEVEFDKCKYVRPSIYLRFGVLLDCNRVRTRAGWYDIFKGLESANSEVPHTGDTLPATQTTPPTI